MLTLQPQALSLLKSVLMLTPQPQGLSLLKSVLMLTLLPQPQADADPILQSHPLKLVSWYESLEKMLATTLHGV